ncbi:MAG: N-acetyl-gamma-glutamyl-phosphate reductase [Loktanella sp.]|nr:N-acetyl-gamma-glutamyl-phosphate reductase [Loktanella sp.]
MKNIAILGASGYTGAELVRLIATHPGMRIAALSGNSKAGQSMASVFPHLRHLKDLPDLVTWQDVDWTGIDLCFCALPHKTSQEVIAALPATLKIVDLSADFRLRDPESYAKWYGNAHTATDLQKEAVYGLTEFYRSKIAAARLVAGTGCNAATGQFILLHAELSEGTNAYGVGGTHRHLGEFDQEFSAIAGRDVRVQFTPHLLPMNRGILATAYVRGDVQTIEKALTEAYASEPFIVVLPRGELPSTHHVRGSNFVHIGLTADRISGRVIVVAALDNLTKGSSGQALQNANLMLGLDEEAGLMLAPVFP